MAAEKNIDDVLVIVHARLQSERCPNKMIRPFAGSTLTDLMLEKLLASQVIPQRNIYLSVYEPELVAIGKRHNVNIFHRSKESAMSEAEELTVLFDWWDKLPFKYVVIVNGCLPLLKTETIDKFVKRYLQLDSDRYLFAVIERKNFFWDKDGNSLIPFRMLNTKTAPVVYEAAHCFHSGSMESIKDNTFNADFSAGNMEFYPLPDNYEMFDIDHEWEFNLYKRVYQMMNYPGGYCV